MPRHFTEEEAQRVFARLAELQGQGHGEAGTLSIDELREAARAAGLDASLVERAVADLDAAPERRRTFLSAPVEVTRSRVVPRHLDDDAWAAMVHAARGEFGGSGMAGQIGSLREWTLLGGGGGQGFGGGVRGSKTSTRLSAEPGDAGTRLTLTQSFREPVQGFSIAGAIHTVMAIAFLVVALVSGDLEFLIPGGIMTLCALVFGGGAQVGARLWADRLGDRFERLLDRQELVARAASPDGEALPTARPALDLDALGEAPDADVAARRARDRS